MDETKPIAGPEEKCKMTGAASLHLEPFLRAAAIADLEVDSKTLVYVKV